ncbi:MAG: phosphatase PAP2 family protein [Elusimicrobia bacterium]|nr:phosphatase PAP2 family protein [Elusimicrobiota bacterium]
MPTKRLAVSLTLVLSTFAAGPAAALDSALRRPVGSAEYAGSAGFFTGSGSAFDHLGRPYSQFGIAAAVYAGGRLAGSPAAQRVGVLGFAALSTTGLATAGLKALAGRSRPYAGEGAGMFRGPGGSGHSQGSFPSGHTSMAFTMAAVAAEELPTWGDVAVYGLATGVGAARVHQDQHWATDVLAGAALGWAVGKGLSRWGPARRFASRLSTDGRGLYFHHRF